MTNPNDFRRDAGVPCPVCRIGQHSFESMQIHYNSHTEEEKRRAWESLLMKKNRTFRLVEVER